MRNGSAPIAGRSTSVQKRHNAPAACLALLLFTGCATYRRVAASRKDPLTVEEHLQLAQSYEAQHLNADARRELSIVLRRDGKNVAALLEQGNLALNDHDLAL